MGASDYESPQQNRWRPQRTILRRRRSQSRGLRSERPEQPGIVIKALPVFVMNDLRRGGHRRIRSPLDADATSKHERRQG